MSFAGSNISRLNKSLILYEKLQKYTKNEFRQKHSPIHLTGLVSVSREWVLCSGGCPVQGVGADVVQWGWWSCLIRSQIAIFPNQM